MITQLKLHQLEREHIIAKLAEGITTQAGQLLAATPAGYVLADNKSTGTMQGIVIATDTSADGEVLAIASGVQDTENATKGNNIYVGQSGDFVTSPPTEAGSWIKCIGTVISSTQWRFEPDSFSIKNE